MNILKKWLIEKEGEQMLTKLFSKIDGYKTYGLAIGAVLIALIGHFWGPINYGTFQIPAFTWTEFWSLVWKAGLVISGRSAVDKIVVPQPK